MSGQQPSFLTRDQVRQVDQIAIQEFGIPGIVLMENAGRGVVDVMRQIGINGPICICCGKGNNGGDGLVIARHLFNLQYDVDVVLCCRPEELQGDAEINLNICQTIGVSIVTCVDRLHVESQAKIERADWIVDCLLGTGAKGAPRPPLDQLIPAINRAKGKRMAVDLPSGLDVDTGQPATPTVVADYTCTFVAKKPMNEVESAQRYLGETHVVDIGINIDRSGLAKKLSR